VIKPHPDEDAGRAFVCPDNAAARDERISPSLDRQ
jgi:hypothetical protein